MFIGPDRSARMLEVGIVDGDLAPVIARSEAERTLVTVVRAAHGKGHSWQSIGTLLGTSGEAARQRYGKPAKDTRQSA